MKKFILLALCVILCIASAAADSLQIDTETATIDELLSARSAIDQRIHEIRLDNAPKPDESFIISGNGTQILNGFETNAPLSRFVINSYNDMKLTCYLGNDSKSWDEETVQYIASPFSLSALMVEADGDWKIDFSPIGTTETPFMSGVGSYVSDVFTVDPPCIVNLSFTEGHFFRYVDVYLCKIDSEGNVSRESFLNYELIIDTESFDRIIKPEQGIVSYFWQIKCATDTKWSITAK